ncbi:hydantoinase/oxoprolinase family protein [Methanohalobium sp.]|uniref:hydantoinase/oxoprolinase family protein n=1 Tax=Methanohalobium sp. TaxID=2837493 RepID=UPI0025F1AEEB|nr:hydantoinase/oxoprolinase family protein [Methanohalobium sp.]
MQYSLGVDAGGTYTDSVILRNTDGAVVSANKALTTYPDLLEGIKNSIDGLDQSYLEDINIVSVSTTLATNTILEKTGYPVGLILIGNYDVPANTDIDYYTVVQGGHDTKGLEVATLDEEKVEEFVNKVKDKVSAFAISSYFSVRNPDHELRIKEIVNNLTDYSVVCGHELSQDLGAYERGVTAYLNAQLIPIANRFIQSIISETERRGIDARLLMLKCDGSVVGINEALEKPIESIFSGPAASLVGAAYLENLDSCAVIDLGGTSTDVSLMENGLPELTETGAVVGGWQTKVKALRMETSAMGGDSHIWVRNQNVNIGPRRVIPLCVAAEKYPGFIDKLKKARVPSRRQLTENIQPTKFYIKTGEEPINLSDAEQRILERIEKSEPASLNEIFWESSASDMYLNILVQKRLVQAVGFTPTDALHVLGEYEDWNVNASNMGAAMLTKFTNNMGVEELCNHVKNEVTLNMSLNLMSYVLKGVDKQEIDKILRGDYLTHFKLDVPVVLIGAPSRVYQDKITNIIDADVRLPSYAEVGNAVGALVGKGIKRIEIMLKSVYSKSKKRIVVFYPGGREEFPLYEDAFEYAKNLGHRMMMDYMTEAGLDKGNVKVDMHRNDITIHEGTGIPVETNLVFIGIGMPKTKKEIEH